MLVAYQQFCSVGLFVLLYRVRNFAMGIKQKKRGRLFNEAVLVYSSFSKEAATRGVLWKGCSQKFRNIHRKTLVLGSHFNNVAGLHACNFFKKSFQHRCFPGNIPNFLKTSILKNIYERLLLSSVQKWCSFVFSLGFMVTCNSQSIMLFILSVLQASNVFLTNFLMKWFVHSLLTGRMDSRHVFE